MTCLGESAVAMSLCEFYAKLANHQGITSAWSFRYLFLSLTILILELSCIVRFSIDESSQCLQERFLLSTCHLHGVGSLERQSQRIIRLVAVHSPQSMQAVRRYASSRFLAPDLHLAWELAVDEGVVLEGTE